MTDEAGEEGGKRKISMVTIAILVGGVIALAVGGFLAYKYIGGLIGVNTSGESENANSEYMALDEMLISIKSNSARQQYLKLKFSFELESAGDRLEVTRNLPRILDDFQAFLRELKVEEIQGSEGWYRLKEEMLIRVNTILAPKSIREVLISDLVIQ